MSISNSKKNKLSAIAANNTGLKRINKIKAQKMEFRVSEALDHSDNISDNNNYFFRHFIDPRDIENYEKTRTRQKPRAYRELWGGEYVKLRFR